MVKLYDVIDTRTGLHHDVAIVKDHDAKWFISIKKDEGES